MTLRRQLLISAALQIGVTALVIYSMGIHSSLGHQLGLLAGMLAGILWAYYRYYVSMREIKRRHHL